MQNSILVPIDFSRITPKVLDNARYSAAAFEARVWLLHVAQTRVDVFGLPCFTRDSVARTLRGNHQEVYKCAENLKQAGVDTAALVVRGNPAQKILPKAEELEANMIILGSHGHGPLHQFLTQHTCQYLLERAPCPVVIVSAKDNGHFNQWDLDTLKVTEHATAPQEVIRNYAI
jgi:nucleotide-binding universal stress UspA family protein